jgi:uncharacterized repeat protein (TIGR01451 family)/LPXTG-motif cell wall-anchored protein
MSKLMALIRRAPKRFALIAGVIVAAVAVPVAVQAWGPTRDTFTIEHPAPYVTFNSITNNPNYGDERNFVTIKDTANTNAGGWTDEVNVENGKEYYVRMYVHNNAAANLNLVAQNVTAKFNVPNYESNRIQIDGYLSSSNAKPTQVWDQAVFNSNSKFSLNYVSGSAMYTNNVFTSGTGLPDSVVSSGATLGYNKMDGNIPGCFQYDGFVTFKVKAVKSDFDVQKTVRASDSTDKTFKENVSVKPGDKVDYQIYFKNTGGTQLKDVVIKDTLPQGMTYVPDTTYLYNSDGLRKVADGVTAGGMIIGGYQPGGDAYIKFTAQVAANDKLPVCGTNTLTNTAKATTSTGSKDDTAVVTVPKECKPVVKYTCDALGVTVVDRTHFTFNTKYTVQNATFKSVTYVIKNANGKVVDTKTSNGTSLNYTQTTVGKYTVQATVTVTVDGTTKTVTSDACKASFEVPAQPGNITVCELSTKKIVTIKENQFDAAKYSKDLSKCADTPVPPVTPPTTPPELPHTGMTENIVAITGLGALIASIAYYVASRRALNQ